ncbi:hypothetical protein DPMN_161224 [Dreissena polymorpha]|uniref:Uncharacterized protein n=1 Tax=Dreissena polymorpha TaxID=45954 RepID=A0A9D4ISE8_DREPO|nr:hypothetical protein DPMN_161224 [Dreissena polymorpha]
MMAVPFHVFLPNLQTEAEIVAVTVANDDLDRDVSTKYLVHRGQNPNTAGPVYGKRNHNIPFFKVRLQTVWTVRQHDTSRLSCLIATGIFTI